MPRCSNMYASMQLADAYDSTYACMNAVDPWKHQNSIIEACNASYSRSDQQIHGTCRQAADHSNSAMEAQASGSYPSADHSNSAMEVQASDSLSSSRQQIIATVLSKRRLVAAIQQQASSIS